MAQLQVRLFGVLEMHFDGTPLPGFPTQKSQDLFAYLVLHPDRLFHRDRLCGRFWGDQSDTEARKALRTALWRIRSVVEPEEAQRGTFLRVDGCQVGFRGTGRAWVDAVEFESCVSTAQGAGGDALDEAQAAGLLHAVSLYRGDLLESHYEEGWMAHRERFRMAYLTALERLIAHCRSRRQWLDAIALGRQLLRWDPLREHIHRTIMRCHLDMGDRPSALRQYEACRRVLHDELQIQPMKETRHFYEEMLADGVGSHEACGERNGVRSRGALHELAADVDDVLDTLSALTERLKKARVALGPSDAPVSHHRDARRIGEGEFLGLEAKA